MTTVAPPKMLRYVAQCLRDAPADYGELPERTDATAEAIDALRVAAMGCGAALDERTPSDVCDYRNRRCLTCRMAERKAIQQLTGVSNVLYRGDRTCHA